MADVSKGPTHDRTIAVIGLDYVGLPVAIAFARSEARTIDVAINAEGVTELQAGWDSTLEVDPADSGIARLKLTMEGSDLKAADFFVGTVLMPTDAAKRPDLTALEMGICSRREGVTARVHRCP